MTTPSAAITASTVAKEVVLKLRLTGSGDPPQIRRVRLSRIQVEGQVSFSALVDVAIKCAYPNIESNVNEHDCTFTYYDVDNDCVTIASTEELMDAIDQFSFTDNPVLRITTDVKRKEDVPVKSAPDTDPCAAGASPPITAKPNQLQNIIESCVSVLTAAVVTLQNQIAEVNIPHATPDTTESSGSAVPTSATKTDSENVANKDSGNIEVEENDESPSGEDTPFIHGRHTCDGCLCTPIIGTRYHATNLPDYDLCAKCRSNYKGSEIQFETQELERDLPFQERWHRKRTRLFGRVQGSPGRGRRGRHGKCRWNQTEHDPAMDAALKEAIRRSLQDTQRSELPPEPSAPADEVSVPTNDGSETFDHAANDNNSMVTAETEVVISVQEVQIAQPTTMTETSFSSQAIGHGDAAESLGSTLDHLAEAIDAVVSEIDRQNLIDSIDAEHHVESVASTRRTFVDGPTIENSVPGEKIVDGEDGRDAESSNEEMSEASEDEWQVVKEYEAEKVASDEMIARAAQLIGSALFQSDLMGTAEREVSVLSQSGGSDLLDSAEFEAPGWRQSVCRAGSDSFSLPSTVPSLMSDNQISPAVLDRWALQLSKLHELGFSDDLAIVAVLERISASLIGVDSEDEVSVTQVINELLKS